MGKKKKKKRISRSEKKQAILQHKIKRPPGELIYTGNAEDFKASIELITYNEAKAENINCKSISDLESKLSKESVNWVNIVALNDPKSIEEIGEIFQVHRMLLEDLLHVDQMPKFEEQDDIFYFTLKHFDIEIEDSDEVKIIQYHINIFWKNNTLITFMEKPLPIFDHIKNRIADPNARIRKRPVDNLFYLVIDSIVDHYIINNYKINDQLSDLELDIIENPEAISSKKILDIKKQIIYLKKMIFPVSESIKKVIRDVGDRINLSSVYLNDLDDHIHNVINEINSMESLVSGLVDLHVSSLSHKMNNVMKTLTIVATIFIPLTFIAGIYGMNFKVMPELEMQYGYYYSLGFMALIGIAILVIMKKRKWM